MSLLQGDFTDYCEYYYGKDGLYVIGKKFATREQLIRAISIYKSQCERFIGNEGLWGGGDSVDRDRVATILVDTFGLDINDCPTWRV